MSQARRGGRAFHDADAPSRRARRTQWLALLGLVGFGLLAAVAGLAASHAVLPLADSGDAARLAAGLLPGTGAWLVWRRVDVGLHRKRAALRLWGCAVLAQAAWPGIAPLLHSAGAGRFALAAAGGLTLCAIRAFWPLGRVAAAMLLPYMAVTAFLGWPGGWPGAGP